MYTCGQINQSYRVMIRLLMTYCYLFLRPTREKISNGAHFSFDSSAFLLALFASRLLMAAPRCVSHGQW